MEKYNHELEKAVETRKNTEMRSEVFLKIRENADIKVLSEIQKYTSSQEDIVRFTFEIKELMKLMIANNSPATRNNSLDVLRANPLYKKPRSAKNAHSTAE